MKLAQTLVAAAAAASVSLNAVGYEDDYLSVAGDESVRRMAVDGRLVYIFTNASVAATVTLKQKLTLEEALVVGGGGGGGGYMFGGGGGGGGVWHDTSWSVFGAGSSFSVTVGVGGIGCSTPDGSSGGDGGESVLSMDEKVVKVPGGGGGAQWEKGGRNGASGGGGTTGFPGAGSEGYGYRGGVGALGGGGGGGGACEYGGHTSITGNNSTPGSAGKGGDGRLIDIAGEPHCYGSGGGGGSGYGGTDATTGLPVHRPGEGGLEGGGRGGSMVAAGGYTTKGTAGVDGLGGGGGGGSNDRAGNGGCGTVVLAFTVGDTTAKRFVVENFEACPIQNGAALPSPVVRDAVSGTLLEKERV